LARALHYPRCDAGHQVRITAITAFMQKTPDGVRSGCRYILPLRFARALIMKTIIRYFFAPLFVLLVLSIVLANGIIQEMRLSLSARHRLRVRRYVAEELHLQ